MGVGSRCPPDGIGGHSQYGDKDQGRIPSGDDMRAGPSCIAGSFTGRDEEGVPDELRNKSRKTLCECRSLKRWLQSLGGQDQKLDSILVGPGRNNAHSLKGEGGKAPTFCWFQPGWGIPGERQGRKSCFMSSHQPGIFSQGPSKMGPLWTPPSPFLLLFLLISRIWQK